jgi:hypothetical protein
MPSFVYNIPSDKQADFLAAMRKKYGVPAATPLEIEALIEQDFKRGLKRDYLEYMRLRDYDLGAI